MKIKHLMAATALVLAGPALAQTAGPRCDGEVQVIRVSTLKGGATVADFQKVVSDHMAWYRAHGFKANVQRVGRVMTPDGLAADKVVTVHVNAPGVPRDKRDADWDKFVAGYRAISDITSEQLVCFPKK